MVRLREALGLPGRDSRRSERRDAGTPFVAAVGEVGYWLTWGLTDGVVVVVIAASIFFAKIFREDEYIIFLHLVFFPITNRRMLFGFG